MAEDLEEECKNYEKMIENVGKIALQILCLGLNGHIGFNEPGISFSSRTHVVDLTLSTTIEANVHFFENIDDVPRKALTMGVQTIMEAKEILFIINGEKKRTFLRKVVHVDVTEEVPASILQRHPNVTVITDIDV